MLRLEGIRKSYMLGNVEVPVLRGIDLEVSAGDLLAIMGPSGSGKSTLMAILGLLGRPTSGAYHINGQDVFSLDDDALSSLRNSRIGFVFQSFNLMPHLTALENVGVPLIYRGVALDGVKRQSRTMLRKVGLEDRIDHTPGQLSGGQKQRVAIARALVGEPAVILADEPTGALDSATAEEVMRLLAELNAREGVTIVVITHDASVAAQCSRQARLGDGTLHELAPGAA